MPHNRYLPRWLARFGIILVVALGIGALPVFAQNYSSGSTATNATASNSMANSTGSGQTSSNQAQSNQSMSNQTASNQTTSSASASNANSSAPTPSRSNEIAHARTMVLKHWSAVANGNANKLDNQYANNAVVVWIGGKLNGTYKGQKAIDDLWSRFVNASAPMQFQVRHIWYDVSDGHPTVSEDVVLKGVGGNGNPIHVTSTLVYKNGKIVGEVWQKL